MLPSSTLRYVSGVYVIAPPRFDGEGRNSMHDAALILLFDWLRSSTGRQRSGEQQWVSFLGVSFTERGFMPSLMP